MPKLPPRFEVPCSRPRSVIVLEDDGDNQPDARSAIAVGGGGQGLRSVKVERSDECSGHGRDGSGDDGHATGTIAPPVNNLLTPFRFPSSAVVICLEKDDPLIRSEPVYDLDSSSEEEGDLRSGGRVSMSVSASGGSRKTMERKRDFPGRTKEDRAGGRARRRIAEQGSSSTPRNCIGAYLSSGDEFRDSPGNVGGSRRSRRGKKQRRGMVRDVATPVKKVRAAVAPMPRSRAGEQTRVLPVQVVSDDGEEEEEQGLEVEDRDRGNDDDADKMVQDSDNICKSVDVTWEEVSCAEPSSEEGMEEESQDRGEELRGAPSNASARGNARQANKESPAYHKKSFEGLCLLNKVDNTTSGQGLRKRTRSNFKERQSLDKKLLKRGTFSKPYCIDASESSSESDGDALPTVLQTQKIPQSVYNDESGGDDRTPAKRKCRREQVANGDGSEDRSSESEDQSTDSEEQCEDSGGNAGKGPSSRRAKKGASYQHNVTEGRKNYVGSNLRQTKKYAANAGIPIGGGTDDISFKKNALFSQRAKHGEILTNQNTHNNLLNYIFDEAESHQNGYGPAQAQSKDKLPLVFSFGDEDQVQEKSEHARFEEEIWREFDFALQSINVGSHNCQEGENCNGQESSVCKTTSCCHGKHDFITDDHIGVWCKHCNFIDLEIRHVVAPMTKLSAEREMVTDRELRLRINDVLTSIGNEGAFNIGCHKTGSVWNLIPGVREDMFPHQRKAFEFIWTKLAGGIDIQQVQYTVNTDNLSGCVISHAPGTGKTRLAITFVQSYLEVFPQCSPVIIAPLGMLATWEQEFRKWNVNLPFHVLNFGDIHWNEDKTIRRLAANDEDLAQRLSMNNLDLYSCRELKLASWCEGNSIIGLSYSLFRKLADQREPLTGGGRYEDKVSRLLLQRPDLLVLDEGHTPRNRRSRIWKVLKKVRTRKRIVLTGTLFQNNFEEVHSILCLLRPEEDEEEKAFWTSLTLNNTTDEKIDQIREKLLPFVDIHNGGILQNSLLGKKETVVILNPLPLQKKIITMIENIKTSGNFDVEYKISLASVHPSLVAGMKNLSDKTVVDKPLLERLRPDPSEGVKTRFVFEIVRLCKSLKERVLVFSQYLEPLDLIVEQLSREFTWTKGKEILQISGNVRVEDRQALMKAFNDMKSEAKIMLASTKACSEGITLIGASRVVLLDVVWNPSVERQAIGRAYRIGQEKTVYTYNLIAEGTMEKGKYDRQAKKDHMSKLLFSNELQPAESPETILSDRILETMSEHEKLKDMFVNIRFSSQ